MLTNQVIDLQENAHLKEMTEEMLSGSDHNPARATPLALEIDSASQEEIAGAYTAMQVTLPCATRTRMK